jgi:hypothetical protein
MTIDISDNEVYELFGCKEPTYGDRSICYPKKGIFVQCEFGRLSNWRYQGHIVFHCYVDAV